ncbi:CHAT domain-containing protein [Foetidibacter luteolus]|uniref:CHAT domain-containing protein n=1 Tax=Foetidibacter luteolus TaxID=2608880 RepID=UPI00129ABE2B|nr:CHAT domain-containing tetratricopeptide repeat protein [Foetidibacter luteolus]
MVSCLLLLPAFFSLARQYQFSNYRQQFNKAIALYNNPSPTPESDSVALQLFTACANSALAARKDYKLAVESLIKAGNIHQTYQRYSQSNQMYHHALSINSRYLRHKALRYEACLYIGSSFYFSNTMDSARHYFEMASSMASGPESATLPEQERLFNSLGAIYFESANYQQAKNYFERALQALQQGAEGYEELYVSIRSNIANCLLRMNQYNEALFIYKSLARYSINKEIILQNTAHTYFRLGHYDSALALYNQLPGKEGLNHVKALNDLGRIYIQKGHWQLAENYFDSAIAVVRKIQYPAKNKEAALALLYRSELARRQGLAEEAIGWCNRALEEVHLDFTLKNRFDIPADVSKAVSHITLFEILQAKASLLFNRYKVTGSRDMLDASVECFLKAIQTAGYIKRSFDNDEARIFFNEQYRQIYSRAVEAAFTASENNPAVINKLLYIIENYKGNALYQNLRSIELKSSAKIPGSIKVKERYTKQLLALYTSRLSSTSETDAAGLQAKILQLQVELSRIQKLYEKDPGYSFFLSEVNSPAGMVKQLQHEIDDNTALLNYYAGDSVMYVVAINKGKAVARKINMDAAFTRAVKLFLEETYSLQEGRRYNGYASAAQLYQSLFNPVNSITANSENLVIVPDGMLNYLPFDALVTDEKQRHYLLLDKTISYHYSFALLLQKSTLQAGGKNKAIVFAPYVAPDAATAGTGLPGLPFSASGLDTAGKWILKSAEATRQSFVENAPAYKLVHLATHASMGTENSTGNWIQFYPADSMNINNRLYLHEIYNLNLHQTELVILSACETAGGANSSGEGLLSLSRAFMYAGSDGVISTLWKTEDRVAALLMQRVHYYLQQKIPPQKALRLAKIDLLNDDKLSVLYKTPNYWGNFVYAGKQHYQSGITLRKYAWFGIFLLALSIWWIVRKRVVQLLK